MKKTLSEGFNELIEEMTTLEIQQNKDLLWRILAMLCIQKDGEIAHEILDESPGELIRILATKSKSSPEVIQDSVSEFRSEVLKFLETQT